MKTNLESAKELLAEELIKSGYVNNLYENAASERKLENYIIESVFANIIKGECLQWLEYKLTENNKEESVKKEIINIAGYQFLILERFKNRK